MKLNNKFRLAEQGIAKGQLLLFSLVLMVSIVAIIIYEPILKLIQSKVGDAMKNKTAISVSTSIIKSLVLSIWAVGTEFMAGALLT